MLKINEGFFVINSGAFTKDESKRHATITPAQLESAKEVKYIVPEGKIMIDADSLEAREKIKSLNNLLGIKPYEYETSKDHMHFWYKTTKFTQKMINKMKLHSSAHQLAFDNNIDTRAFNTDTEKTGAVYLKTEGKLKSGRPTPEKLVEALEKPLPEVPAFLLMHKNIGLIPKSGESWNNKSLPIVGKLKGIGLNADDVNEIFSQAAKYYGDTHSIQEIIHKFNDAKVIDTKIGKWKSEDIMRFIRWDASNNRYEVANWDGTADVIIDQFNMVKYQGVIPVALEGSEYKVLTETPAKVASSFITKKRLNLSPQLISQISRHTENMMENVYPKLNDRFIYFSNGDYDLERKEFIPNEKPEYNHRRLPNKFSKPSEETLGRVNELFRILQTKNNPQLSVQIMEMFACMLVPTIVHRKMFQLHGNGHNGKSTIVEIFLKALGDNKVATLKMDQILSSRAFDRIQLPYKMVNWIDDLDKTKNHNIGGLKTLVSGGSTNAEIKGGSIFSFKNEATIVFGANFHLDANDGSDAIQERLHIIPFDKKIKKTKWFKESDYEDKEFLEAMLWLAVGKAVVLNENGWILTETQNTLDAKKEQLAETNSVFAWLEESEFGLSAGSFVTTKGIYGEYREWCSDNGRYPQNAANFGKQLKKFRPEISKDRTTENGKQVPIYINKNIEETKVY